MITQEVKQQILNDYNDSKNTLRDLEAFYGIPRQEITRIAVEMGATPRRPNMYGKSIKRKEGAKVCHKCKKKIDVKGARFCCYCGADIRSKQEILCERIRELMPRIQLLPENMRDDTRDVMLAAIEEITSNAEK